VWSRRGRCTFIGDDRTNIAEPVEVAACILTGKPHKFDGAPPRTQEKLDARARHCTDVEFLTNKLRAAVLAKLEGRDLYAFTRKTHITLARMTGVNPDAVAAQVGHTGGGVEEKFYVDESMMSPALSSDAVWRLITEIDDGEAGALVLWRHPARRL